MSKLKTLNRMVKHHELIQIKCGKIKDDVILFRKGGSNTPNLSFEQ